MPGRSTCATATASWIGAPSVPYVRRVVLDEEVVELGDERPGRARGAEPLDVRRHHQRLVGDVEADHRHRHAAVEDAPRRLGVDVDVELGRRGDVPLGDRAAHDHDPLHVLGRLGVVRQEERDVRQRADRDERDRPGRAEDPLGEEVDRVLLDRCALRVGQARPVEPGLAMDVGGDEELAGERPVGAGCDVHVPTADELEDAQGVRRRLLERLVPGDRRDAQEVELRAREREQERDRVVVPRVAVEQDRRRVAHARSISSTSAAVGSEG